MLNNPNLEINGLPLSTAIMPEYDSVEDFVAKVVFKPNEDATLLVIVLAPSLLHISVDIALFDSKRSV